MKVGGIIGAGDDVAAQEQVLRIERDWQRMFGKRTKLRFWPDVEVRRYLILQHGFMTIDMVRSRVEWRFGAERTPARSTIGRFWLALDKLEKRK